MTRSATMRIFFALEPNQALKETCASIVRTLKHAIHSHGIRWVRPENYHITLCFMGSFEQKDLASLISKVKAHTSTLSRADNAETHIAGFVTFPNFYRPRILALDFHPPGVFTSLAEALSALTRQYVAHTDDHVPYHAHLTLGRIKHPASVAIEKIQNCPIPSALPFMPTHITLYQSEPHPEGSHYTVLERFPSSWVGQK
jgi:2'-5' RNA ligase